MERVARDARGAASVGVGHGRPLGLRHPELLQPRAHVELVLRESEGTRSGPHGDAGLTGRKIIVDTYGGMGRHGGGAFSGKDPTKVDRSAAYAARWAAKTVIAAGLARRCEIQLAYAIGVAEPVSVRVDTFGTGNVADEAIARGVREVFDFRPGRIIEELQLRNPIYRATAAYGHFGRAVEKRKVNGREVTLFPWEDVGRADALRSLVAG